MPFPLITLVAGFAAGVVTALAVSKRDLVISVRPVVDAANKVAATAVSSVMRSTQ